MTDNVENIIIDHLKALPGWAQPGGAQVPPSVPPPLLAMILL